MTSYTETLVVISFKAFSVETTTNECSDIKRCFDRAGLTKWLLAKKTVLLPDR